MAKTYAMSATKRDRAGKGAARALRRENQTPAVIYGDKKDPITVSLSTKDANLEYNKAHMFTTICELDVEGTAMKVLARDVQLHPVSDNVMHVDFLRVTDKTKITVAVPVHFMNQEECAGIIEKGVLNIIRYEVDIDCKATAIPDEIAVDLTDFNIGDAVKISDAVMPEGATPTISDRDFALASITERRAIEEEPVAEEEGAEGEEGVEGEEGAEGADGEKAEGDAKPEEGKKE